MRHVLFRKLNPKGSRLILEEIPYCVNIQAERKKERKKERKREREKERKREREKERKREREKERKIVSQNFCSV